MPKPPPTNQDEIIHQVDQLNKDIHRICNELNKVNLRWACITTYINKGYSFEDAVKLIQEISGRTNERLYRGLTLLEEGVPLENVLRELHDDMDGTN